MIKKIEHNNKEIYYKIIKKNNKHTYFRFEEKYLEISMPKKIKEKTILNYIINNFNEFYIKYQNHLKSIPNEYEVILEEKTYKLNIINQKGFSYKIKDDFIYVYTNIKEIRKIKYKIYENHLLLMINKLKPKINEVLNENNIKKASLKLSYYKSKFGSYNRKKHEISLNVILAKANINYLFYVIMHEYAHTKEFNHSKNFYNVLKLLMNNYKYYDKTIKNLSIWL